jgi:hypothetical protein
MVGRRIAPAALPDPEVCLEVEAMSENVTDTILSNSNVEEAARQGKAAFRRGVDAARKGVDAARDGVAYAQDYASDGLDMMRELSGSLSQFVSRQPLIAVAGAFLIGYMAARMLRRASSS